MSGYFQTGFQFVRFLRVETYLDGPNTRKKKRQRNQIQRALFSSTIAF